MQDRRRPRAITLRDPIWDTIRLDRCAVRIVDSAAFQRLRYIKQLGLAHLVYPGASHTRFDHALGVYHLAQRALAALSEKEALAAVPDTDRRLVPLAGLLHDVGHYPFSHAVEELEPGLIPGHHEAVIGRFLTDPDVDAALTEIAPDARARVEALVRGTSDSPLQGLVSGSIDLDKIEYLKRDARFCGVPYGEVDVDRLLHELVLVRDPGSGRLEIGVTEKGTAALESLLFSKYQMFRNVYWHHATRAATVMYKRIVADALGAGLLDPEELVGETDEELLFLLQHRSRAAEASDAVAARVARRVADLRQRRLPKRAAEVVAADLEGEDVGEWAASDSMLKRGLEDRLAAELGLEPGAAFLDYPSKRAMFGLDILVAMRSGEVFRLGPGGRSGLIGLPRIADELYRTARVLRLFTLDERRVVDPAPLVRLAGLTEAEAQRRLEDPAPLL